MPDAVPFQPKPTRTQVPVARGDWQEGSSQTTLPQRGASGGDFDVHAAETMILDNARRPTARPSAQMLAPPPRKKGPTRPPPPPPTRPRQRTQGPIDDFDEALHNAPTMIIDGSRLGRRR